MALRRLLGWHIRARWLIVIVPVGYVLFAAVVWFGADSLIFEPHPSGYRDTADIIKLETSDGVEISAVHRQVPHARYTVLLAHGNAEDVSDLTDRIAFLNGLSVDVFAFDYHGFGTSEGSPSESNTYRDIDAAYDYLVGPAGVTPEHIIVLGRSLGAAVALDLAVRRPIGGFILESAFTCAFRVAVPFPVVPFDKYDNLAKIDDYHGPLAVVHGTADGIIDLGQGKQLYAKSDTRKAALWIEGAGHNDVLGVGRARYAEFIDRFLIELA